MKKMKKCISVAIVTVMLMIGTASASPESTVYDECAATAVANEAGPDSTATTLMEAVELECGDKLIDAMISLDVPVTQFSIAYIVSYSVAENILNMTKYFAGMWDQCEAMNKAMEEAHAELSI